MSTQGPTIFDLPCPGCGVGLVPDDVESYHCGRCGQSFRSIVGYLEPIMAPIGDNASVDHAANG